MLTVVWFAQDGQVLEVNIVLLMPTGVWFAQDGQVLEVNIVLFIPTGVWFAQDGQLLEVNIVLFIPTGVWFAQDGQLLEVNLQVAPLSASNIVAVQVLRPTCPQNKVVMRPGKNTLVKSPLL